MIFDEGHSFFESTSESSSSQENSFTSNLQIARKEKDIVAVAETAEPAEQDEFVGSEFLDRFEILKVIGRGGMGKVYLAKHKLMKRMVAIKVIDSHPFSNDTTLKRFQQEAESVSLFNHPNIVAVHDFGLSPRPYLIMDYLNGGSLSDLLKYDAHLALEPSLQMFIQLCSGLAHAHRLGVIHRDLKPCNIMLVKREGQIESVKIVDFGIAKYMQNELDESKQLTANGEILGSLHYMCPEQFGDGRLDGRSDIYSLGCIMYRTLTGHQAVVGQGLLECAYKHIYDDPKSFEEVCPELNLPKALQTIVFRCMAKEPESRFQSIVDLKTALEAFYHSGKMKVLNPEMSMSDLLNESVRYNDSTQSPAKGSAQICAVVEESVRAAAAAESIRAAVHSESVRSAYAIEELHAAEAAERIRAIAATESSRARSAAESLRVIAAKETARARSAAESVRAFSAAESARAAVEAEAKLSASAQHCALVAAAVEEKRAAFAADLGSQVSAAENYLLATAAELSRSSLAHEGRRVNAALEAILSAAALEEDLVALALETAAIAAAHEECLSDEADEIERAARYAESNFVARAVESERAVSFAEASRSASASESIRIAIAAEYHRTVNASERLLVAAVV